PRIFRLFYTRKARGTGVGLAVVKRIVEGHGGRIDVSREGGHGSEVRVSLPLRCPGAPGAPGAAVGGAGRPPTTTPRHQGFGEKPLVSLCLGGEETLNPSVEQQRPLAIVADVVVARRRLRAGRGIEIGRRAIDAHSVAAVGGAIVSVDQRTVGLVQPQAVVAVGARAVAEQHPAGDVLESDAGAEVAGALVAAEDRGGCIAHLDPGAALPPPP